MNDRILSLLGLCRRAGRLTIGAAPCIEAIQKKKAFLLVYASDFSNNSAKPVLEAAHKGNVRILNINRNKDEISFALGKLCGVAAVEDEGFANKLVELIESEQGGELYDKIQG